MIIRPAETRDLPAILDFWNPIIRETTTIFSSEERTVESLGAMIAARRIASVDRMNAPHGEGR